MIVGFQVAIGLWLFGIGSVIGSFLNVCIYRIPWEKSVVWPGSHCPRCLSAIAARDNIPIVSWLALRGECRGCGLPIAARYAVVELLTGLLFLGVYLIDVVLNPSILYGSSVYATMAYHQLLVAFLLVAALIDFDLTIIPDEVTVPGMALGLGIGALVPWIRPEPWSGSTPLAGLWAGVLGWLVAGAMTWAFRIVFSIVFRGEALGFGDVTLMAMIGAFLGWQAAVLAFFLAPFFGMAHALWKGAVWLGKLVRGDKTTRADREIIFGPYLGVSAIVLMLAWPWLWPGWARGFFQQLAEVSAFLVGLGP